MTALEFSHQIIGHESSLRLFTKRFTQDEEYSKDLVQETILKALTNRSKFREHINLKGWLFTILRNTFISNYRKGKSFQKVNSEAGDFLISNEIDLHTFNKPDKYTEYQELLAIVKRLPENLKNPFEMHFKGYKYDEIAEMLQIPIGTVKNRIYQARKTVQRLTQNTLHRA
jgi:RNA polymerase sigma-70 factor (ECF subfamily)